MITYTVADRLDQLVDDVSLRLRMLEEEVVAARPDVGKWSIKEIIGHLLDSAVNNHHRFVRAKEASELTFPSYEQNDWVARQNYQDTDWPALLELWRLYNHQIAHIIRQIPEGVLYSVCHIGSHDPSTLRFIVEDYVDHMQHHLEQVDIQANEH